jgi:hypothetical protein
MRTFRPLTLLLWTGLIVFALATAAAPASAQSADFSGVQPKGLPTVYVTDRQGQETKGKIVSWTDSAVVLRVDDGATRTFKTGEAVRIDLRGDSLKNGALIGAGVGLAIGLMTSAACWECDGRLRRHHDPGLRGDIRRHWHRYRCADTRSHAILERGLVSGHGRRIDGQHLCSAAKRVCGMENRKR